MKRKLVLFLMIVLAVPSAVWSQTVNADFAVHLRQADQALAQFEQTTDRINFSSWNAPYGLVNSARLLLDQTRSNVRGARRDIANFEGSGAIDSIVLFQLIESLHEADIAVALSANVYDFAKDNSLGADLLKSSTATDSASKGLRSDLITMLRAEHAASNCTTK